MGKPAGSQGRCRSKPPDTARSPHLHHCHDWLFQRSGGSPTQTSTCKELGLGEGIIFNTNWCQKSHSTASTIRRSTFVWSDVVTLPSPFMLVLQVLPDSFFLQLFLLRHLHSHMLLFALMPPQPHFAHTQLCEHSHSLVLVGSHS